MKTIDDLPTNFAPNPVYLDYYVEEQNGFGCFSESRAKITVAIYPEPSISTNDTILICSGELFDLANLNIIDAALSDASFSYYRGSISQNILLNSS